MNCIFSSPILTRSGYGEHARSIAKAIISSGKFDSVSFIPMPWGNTPTIALDNNNPDHKNILDRLYRGPKEVQKPDVWIQMTIPNEFQRNGTHYNIGITAGIETTLTAKEWIDGLNRMDLNIVTSDFSKNVFIHNRFEDEQKRIIELNKPMEVLFEGVDLNIFSKKKSSVGKDVLESKMKELPDFCFLFVGHWLQGNLGHDRKDIGMLIKTFLDTFKRKQKRPALLLKTSMAGFSVTENEVISDKIEQIKDSIIEAGWKGTLPKIYIVSGDMTDEEMNYLYNHPKVKCMVSFTHGEGFGRPLLEFTTTGKPVIAPNWSGQIDFLHPEYSVLLPGELIDVDASAHNQWIIKGSKWYCVNYPYASQVLMQVYENYDFFINRSRKHVQYTEENFSDVKMIERFSEILDRYIEEAPKEITLNFPKLKKI